MTPYQAICSPSIIQRMIAAGKIRVAASPSRFALNDAVKRKTASSKHPQVMKYNRIYGQFRRDHARKPNQAELAVIQEQSWINDEA